MTETARRLHRLGSPHAHARAFALLLSGSGIVLATAAAGVWLAPHLAAVVAAWVGVGLAFLVSIFMGWRAFSRSDAPALAPTAERLAGARAGSITTIVAASTNALPGSSVDLFEAADAKAAEIVTRAAPQLSRMLRRENARRLGLGAALAVLGALLFVASSPDNGRASGFWHPLRALALARSPLQLSVDRTTVRRGATITATVNAPGVAGGRVTLWTRRAGEPWRPILLNLDSTGIAMHALGPLESDLWARASQGSRRSREVRVTVGDPAFLADLSVVAQFPAYLNRADEPIAPSPDTVVLPVGTELLSRGVSSVRLAGAVWRAIGEGTSTALRVNESRFEGRFVPAQSGSWRLVLAAADGAPLEGEPPLLVLRLVADSSPTVTVPIPGRDTTLPLSMIQPLVIDARDDHGIARVSIVSWRASQTGVTGAAVRETLDVQGAGERVILQAALRAEQRGLLPGDTLRFRIDAWDNAPTPHEGRSPEYALRLPTRAELRAAQREATADIAAAAESVTAAQRALAERTTDLAQERQREGTSGTTGRQPPPPGSLPFQSSERAQELARQQEAVAERVRELSQSLEELARAAQAAGINDTAFQARLQEVQEMLARAVTPELEQRLRDLQAALARLDPEATRDALRRLAEAQQQMRETLERSEQLFRRAAVEGQLASLAQDAEALRHEQAQWNQRAAPRPDSAAAAAERALADRADSLAAGIQQTERDLAAAQAAAADSQSPMARSLERANRASQAMEQAAGSAERADARGARQSGAQAEQALDSLQSMLRRQRQSVAGQWRQEALDALDQALAETAALAERQRAVTRALESGENPASARAQQAALEEGAEAVQRQIRDAGARHALVSPGIQSALGFAQRQMRAASQQLEQAQPNTEAAAQQAGEALDALNVTAYALAQSRAEVAGAQSGSGFQEAVERLAQLAGQQQGLNQDAMGLMPMAGAGGDQMLQQMRALAARQRALAEQLERLQASGGSSAAGPLAEEARDLARQLDAGRLDRPTIERQERLYRRLLDAGRTLSGREPDENQERTSRASTGDSVHVPVRLTPDATSGPRIRYPSWRDLERMTPEQRRLVLEYFRLLNAPPPN